MKLVIGINAWGGDHDFKVLPLFVEWLSDPTISIKNVPNHPLNRLDWAYHAWKSLRTEKFVKNLQNGDTFIPQNSLNWECFSHFSLYPLSFRYDMQIWISPEVHFGRIRLGMSTLKMPPDKLATLRSHYPPSRTSLDNQLHIIIEIILDTDKALGLNLHWCHCLNVSDAIIIISCV